MICRRRSIALYLRHAASVLVVLLACATPRQPGTAMKSTCPPTVELPTVEECHEASVMLTDDVLRMCVQHQCRNSEVKCS